MFEAGKSGKYILRPVVSESGTDEEIEVVGEKKGDEDEKEDGEKDDEKAREDADALNATFVGNVTRGENVTVSATRNGSAVANATVSVNGENVGETAVDGTPTVAVPDRPELGVEVDTDDGSAELERKFGTGDDETENKGNGN
ncbi:hypothetical protein [Halorussus caseinilyticus]|uniref:Uncharacterized protein n=1 Tax=Halorussus caseinilyticus TaxID=3034025 RepID=A0ABD5WSK4_9EURY|nr:hypothetical protein [Halorussus sp. DT72]